MKKSILLLLCIVLGSIFSLCAQVSINTDGSNPDPSAMLDVNSTDKGLLPPRMTQTQRDAITAPAAGLIIWCTNCGISGEMQYYNGISWSNITPLSSICNQVWMNKNLNVSTYRNGDPIPEVTDWYDWLTSTTGAYCYYNNDSATYAATYGKLYNWYAVNDPRGLAPAGWHIPSDAEWTTLINCIGGYFNNGGALKEAGTTHWNFPNTEGKNCCGFTGLPGGFRDDVGTFSGVGQFGAWWSSTESLTNSAVSYWLYSDNAAIIKYTYYSRYVGCSVRCLRD